MCKPRIRVRARVAPFPHVAPFPRVRIRVRVPAAKPAAFARVRIVASPPVEHRTDSVKFRFVPAFPTSS